MAAASQPRIPIGLASRLSGVYSHARGGAAERHVVLVVEDSFLERKVVVNALREAGLETVGVSTLAEALVEIQNSAVGLVFVDRHLPDGDGFDLVRAIRAASGTANIPVVALTGSTRRHDVDAAVIAGCDGFLAKPCPLEHIVAAALERLVR